MYALRQEPRRSAERRARPKRAVSVRRSLVARAAPEAFSDGNIQGCGVAVDDAPVGAPPPLHGGPSKRGQSSGREQKRSARMMKLVIASQRTRAKSRGPMTGSAKQSRGACDDCEAALDCFGPLGLAMTMQRERDLFHLSAIAGEGGPPPSRRRVAIRGLPAHKWRNSARPSP